MTCSKCGKEILDGKKFCGYCGGAVTEPEAVVAVAEKTCGQCGAVIKEGTKFCGKCGANTIAVGLDIPKPASPEKSQKGDPKTKREKISKPKKKHKKPVMFIVSFVVLLVLLAGVLGAYYVAKNGWENIPFAEKLTFLPFVKIDNEKTETYSDTIGSLENKNEDDEKKGGSGENLSEGSAAVTDESDAFLADRAKLILGDWICESGAKTWMARYKTDNTFILLLSDRDKLEYHGIAGVYEMPSSPEDDAIAMTDIKGDTYRTAFTGTALKIGINGNQYTFEKSQLTDVNFTGIWRGIGGGSVDIIEFLTSGDCRVGSINSYSEIIYADEIYGYNYDRNTKFLTLHNPDVNNTEVYTCEIIGTYALLFDDNGSVMIFSKNLGDAHPAETSPTSLPATSPGNDYVLPDSDRRYLTAEDINGLTADELRIARNEIYARHGRLFSSEELQAYFNGKSWYRGTISPDAFTESMLSDIEKKNVKLIQQMETLFQ